MGDLRTALGGRLQELREAARLTQAQLAAKAGIDAKYLGDIENARKSASLEVIERLMKALGVEPRELFSFNLRARSRGPDAQERLISDAVRHADPDVRRLSVTVLKDILRWRRPGRGS